MKPLAHIIRYNAPTPQPVYYTVVGNKKDQYPHQCCVRCYTGTAQIDANVPRLFTFNYFETQPPNTSTPTLWLLLFFTVHSCFNTL